MKNKIEILRKLISKSQKIENQDTNYILKWLKKRNQVNKMKVKKVPVNELHNWSNNKNGNIFHKSGQFFSVEGVKISNAIEREVSSWDQPILNQKHGGILAIIFREKRSWYSSSLFSCERCESKTKRVRGSGDEVYFC